AHSGPLDVAAAGGIPALVAWCIVIGMMLRAALRASRSSRPWLVGVGAALIAHFAGQLLLFPTAELEPIAWLLAGVLITATTSTAPVHAPAALRRPLSATLGLVAAMSLVAGALDVVADRHAGTAASTRDPATAVRAATDAVDVRPDEVRLHLLLAQALVADDRGTVAAIAAVDDALRISPRDPIALRQRAQLLVQRATATHLPDDVSAARRAADTLVARDPHNAALLLIAGTAARLAADAPAAEAAFARAEGLSPRSAVPSIELALLYLDTGRTADARAAAARAVARDPQDQRAQEVQRRALAAG
ncbi:MAG: hypothetical protein QOI42_712, partial [Frankiaceae bacterium]|nr:hypothetical protein [Frankiaceae bacterium]